MFKIEAFCDDKRLPDVLRALAGKAMNVVAVPVLNAQPKEQVKAIGRGDVVEMFLRRLQEQRKREFRAPDLASFLEEIGLSKTSVGHYLTRMRRAKIASCRGKSRGASWTLVGGVK